ncbi:hypothetical protein HYQ46_000984 [Verticillium longisporum]|nr:hypothetical protein HYQ46_000984 [Verticillium longisporum]
MRRGLERIHQTLNKFTYFVSFNIQRIRTPERHTVSYWPHRSDARQRVVTHVYTLENLRDTLVVVGVVPDMRPGCLRHDSGLSARYCELASALRSSFLTLGPGS